MYVETLFIMQAAELSFICLGGIEKIFDKLTQWALILQEWIPKGQKD